MCSLARKPHSTPATTNVRYNTKKIVLPELHSANLAAERLLSGETRGVILFSVLGEGGLVFVALAALLALERLLGGLDGGPRRAGRVAEARVAPGRVVALVPKQPLALQKVRQRRVLLLQRLSLERKRARRGGREVRRRPETSLDQHHLWRRYVTLKLHAFSLEVVAFLTRKNQF